MNKPVKFAITFFVVFFSQSVLANDDGEGCKHHPLLNRMPGYRINACEIKQFDAREFPASGALYADNKAVKVEAAEVLQIFIVDDMQAKTKTASGLQIPKSLQSK